MKRRACNSLSFPSTTPFVRVKRGLSSHPMPRSSPLYSVIFAHTLSSEAWCLCDFQRRLYAAQAARKVEVAAAVEPVKFLPQEVQVSGWWFVSLSTETLLCGHSKGPALNCASVGRQGLGRCSAHVPGCSCMCGAGEGFCSDIRDCLWNKRIWIEFAMPIVNLKFVLLYQKELTSWMQVCD